MENFILSRKERLIGLTYIILSIGLIFFVNPLYADRQITGNANPCINIDEYYTLNDINGCSNFSWSCSPNENVTITNADQSTATYNWTQTGQYTIHVTYDHNNQSYECEYNVSVRGLPAAAGSITGTDIVCQGQDAVPYSIGAIENATSYLWTYSETGATINGTTNTVTIDFAEDVISGSLTVRGVNECGLGTISAEYAITVNPLPTLSNVSQNVPVCEGNSAQIQLTGLQAGSSFNVNYTIDNVAQDIVAISSDASGNANFITPPLQANQDGKTLEINSLTNTSTSCSQAFTGKTVVLLVYENAHISGLVYQTVCKNLSVELTYIVTGSVTNVTCDGLVWATCTYNATYGTCIISGTPTAYGSFPFTLTAIVPAQCQPFSFSGTIYVADPLIICSTNNNSQQLCNETAIGTIQFTITQNYSLNNDDISYNFPSWLYHSFNDNTITISGTPSVAGTFSYTITMCNTTTGGTITVYELPVANAGEDQTILSGNYTTLHGSATSGTGSYTWLWKPADKINGSDTTQNVSTVPLNEETTFTLTVTDVHSCTDDVEVTIHVTGGILSVNATANPNTVCLGDTVSLAATTSGGSGSYSYSWTSNTSGWTSTEKNPKVIPNVSTTYTVTVTDGGSATASASVSVTVNPRPEVEIEGLTTACGDAAFQYSTEGGMLNYRWYVDGLLVGNDSLLGYTWPNPALSTERTLSVNYTDQHGCRASDSSGITINVHPHVRVSASADPASINPGETSTLTATIDTAGTGIYIYSWAPANMVVNPDDSVTATQQLNSTKEFIVTVKESAMEQCSDNGSVTVNVNNSGFYVVINGFSSVCKGVNITLYSQVVNNQQPITSYEWYYNNNKVGDEDALTYLIDSDKMDFTLKVTCGNNVASDNHIVNGMSGPEVTSLTVNDDNICLGDQITCNANVNNAIEYEWKYNNEPTGGSNTQTLTYTPAISGKGSFGVRAKGSNGCWGEQETKEVNINPLPEIPALSPDVSELCSNQKGLLFSINNPDGSNEYKWIVGNECNGISFSEEDTKPYFILDIPDGCENFDMTVKATNTNTRCASELQKTFTISSTSNAPPFDYKIYKKGEYMLIYGNSNGAKPSAFNTRWGKTLLADFTDSIAASGVQYVDFYPEPVDTHKYLYWLESNENLCRSRIYYGVKMTGKSGDAEEAQAYTFKIVPNPAKGTCCLALPRALAYPLAMRWFDIQGRMVFSKQINNASENCMDVSPLDPGIYLVRLNDAAGHILTEKVIVL